MNTNTITNTELHEYTQILLTDFNFTITELATLAGVERTRFNRWYKDPQQHEMTHKATHDLTQYVMYLLFGNGLTDMYAKKIIEADDLVNSLRQKRTK